MAGARYLSLALAVCLFFAGYPLSIDAGRDQFPECEEWAERGDCNPSGRPYFMQKNCAESCHKKTFKEPERRQIADDQEEFYELTAKTSTGKVLSMENFEGYITVLVNSARVCDYSEIFYDTLEHMHSVHPFALEIIAFPFDHPSADVKDCKEAILSDEKKAGRKIHVMEAVKINGSDTHPIYKYLKKIFDMEEMDPNRAHYFFMNPDGTVIEHHYGASYEHLKQFVNMHLGYYSNEF